MSSVFFPLSDCWGGGIVFIHDSSPTGSLVAKIPLDFLRKSGVNTWDFVLDIVNMLVDPVPNCPGMIESTEGDAVDLAAAPSEGQYVFKQAGSTSPITYSRGPEYGNKYKTASSVSNKSASSSAPSSSTHQSKFRTALVGRDFTCLITGDEAQDCDAAHIVPKSRPDAYREILELGALSQPPLYAVYAGLLLNVIVHRRYDSLEWSIYHKDNAYYVHFFVKSKYSDLHGKTITRDRFRLNSDLDLPNPKLLAWHYAQCVRGHIRGFAAQIPGPAEQMAAIRSAALEAIS